MTLHGGHTRSLKERMQALPVRMTLFLSLALLPIGYLAVFQTLSIADTSRDRADLSLIAMTELASAGETELLERGFGAAEALASVASATQDDPGQCVRVMRRFLGQDSPFGFAGFVAIDGQSICNTTGRAIASTLSTALTAATEPRIFLQDRPIPAISDGPAVFISHPVTDRAGTQLGALLISLPVSRIAEQIDREADDRPLSLTLFNADQELLLRDFASDDQALPAEDVAAQLTDPGRRPRILTGIDDQGNERRYVVAPLVPSRAYTVASWPVLNEGSTLVGVAVPPALLPVMMWITSLLVAYFAVHRLVVRHIQRIQDQMQRFGTIRFLPTVVDDATVPQEIHALETAFSNMAMGLMTEEARMEDALREKNVLMKEVHHRVKNNLQLISSIISMQTRALPDDETREIMNRLQDRVLGLATVYRCLYTSSDMARIDTADLLNDVVNQSLGSASINIPGLTVDKTLASTTLTPDQAVPLALLTSEVATNALQSVKQIPEGAKSIQVLFTVDGDAACLTCRNTCDNGASDPASNKKGLSESLMNAFATQLEGDLSVMKNDGWSEVVVTFKIEDETHADQDY